MTFLQLEKAYSIVERIHQYEALIDHVDNGIHASRPDSSPSGGQSDPHRIELVLIQREKAFAMLPRLRLVRDDYLPRIRQTVEAATAGCKPTARLRLQLIFRLRYEQGLSWSEIQDIAGIKDPKMLVMKCLEVSHDF